MAAPKRYELLEACPVADEALWLAHVSGFVEAFVVPAKRDRWRELLTLRPRRVAQNSHKLHADLDRRRCARVSSLAGIAGDCVFYGFSDVPRVVPVLRAEAAAGAGDAILSLVPGELAVYIFHEYELWLCRSDAARV